MENDSTMIAIVATIVSTLVGFFFGKSGIFNRILNGRMQDIERAQNKEEKLMAQVKSENEALHKHVDELTQKVKELELDLHDTKQRLDIMLAYFEKINPNPDAFIDKVIKKK